MHFQPVQECWWTSHWWENPRSGSANSVTYWRTCLKDTWSIKRQLYRHVLIMLCVYKKSEAIKHKKAEEMKRSTYSALACRPPLQSARAGTSCEEQAHILYLKLDYHLFRVIKRQCTKKIWGNKIGISNKELLQQPSDSLEVLLLLRPYCLKLDLNLIPRLLLLVVALLAARVVRGGDENHPGNLKFDKNWRRRRRRDDGVVITFKRIIFPTWTGAHILAALLIIQSHR